MQKVFLTLGLTYVAAHEVGERLSAVIKSDGTQDPTWIYSRSMKHSHYNVKHEIDTGLYAPLNQKFIKWETWERGPV